MCAYGKWLAIDPEYEKPKRTRNHNTVLVNGRGQLGEGQTWFDRDALIEARASSSILKAETCAEYDYLVGDAKTIYGAALSRFHRHMLYIKPDMIVIIDDLRADAPARFDWLLHTEIGFEQHRDQYCLARNEDVGMDIHFLYPEHIQSTVEVRTLILSLEPDTDACILIVLHPRPMANTPSKAHLKSFQQGELALDITTSSAQTSVKLSLEKQHAACRSTP